VKRDIFLTLSNDSVKQNTHGLAVVGLRQRCRARRGQRAGDGAAVQIC
jgi:hypothetical protein